METAPKELKIAYLYPQIMNIYGDRGNVLTLYKRCQWRNISVSIDYLDLGEAIDPEKYDLYFMGGGQDAQQIKVCEDLHAYKAKGLKEAAETGAVFLTICGGYQLLGHYYKPHEGNELRGLSLIDAYTVAGHQRFIGNVIIENSGIIENKTLQIVGFENHSGLTYLGEGVSPLGSMLKGYGNNGKDKTEGVVSGNLYGTYLHGSLLPKNPDFADALVQKALARRYGNVELEPLDNALEYQAHQQAEMLKQ